MRFNNILSAGLSGLAGLSLGMFPTSILASSAVPWQKGFQPAVTTVMEDVNEFHDLLLIVITLITCNDLLFQKNDITEVTFTERINNQIS